jgi:hypothetical protein
MKKRNLRTSLRNPLARSVLFVLTAGVGLQLVLSFASAQAIIPEANGFRIGERLTYNVSVGRYRNAAYAELYTVSKGKIGDKEAVELRAKFKTLNVASAATYLVDQVRTTFVSPTTLLPLLTTIVQGAYGLPQETTQNFMTVPSPHTDLLSMIHRLRRAGGTGSVTMQDGEKVYLVNFQPGGGEHVVTDAGEFDTNIVNVQSTYFTERGMSDIRVALSKDEASLPVAVKIKTAKGEFHANLASIQTIEPETTAQPTPVAVQTPVPERTPKPVATPTPYIDNQPLHSELGFAIGERLQYTVKSNGSPVATMNLITRERKMFDGRDTLLLEAYFSDVRGGSPFANGDIIRAHVDPDTLAPRRVDIRFSGPLRAYSSTAKFEQEGSSITYAGTTHVNAPVGTHSVLSLLYASRSFNLKPSRDLNNPINDTRVAVFWESQPYVFTLRPSMPEVITIDGKPVGAQLISVTTRNPQLDQLAIKFWLGTDDARTPLRFSIGGYTADLVKVERSEAE